MVIPTVIQVGASSTADITNNCPEWGIYVEGLRGILLPLTRFARVAMRMLCFLCGGCYGRVYYRC